MSGKAVGNDAERVRAAGAALDEVRSGMKLGLGSGRTAHHFVRLLGARVRDGLSIVGVPTSETTAQLAKAEGIPLATLDDHPALDLTVDGADEIDRAFRLIKGGGGALLREKIVASASARMVVIVDAGKLVDTLGAFPLPIEVTPFGLGATRLAIETAAGRLGLTGELVLRIRDDQPFLTDGGHHILDASFGRIPDPEALSTALSAIPGVMEHGLFLNMASVAIVGREDDVERLTR
ncbi:MAG: ribose-5-phosphate isomerase RpiA [Bauldia sp.]|uniref:ribose-5-phosphate isomerase RpiA n=1 Tax=Bauldia sp. TaxID=2575872 RepID=UPI001DDF6F2C|nr:ribose-5-phosphate isomerase RpiA [Bauldia sp.]MCB1487622.1 ribose-5-phosphate isomerase RpiA [Bauldia sp.]MCB1496364.1 ribose-5-phosphate isomerase RpiA [Bauldia sp.]